MAITKLTFPRSKPTTDGPIDVNDYIYQNSHLMAFINQINSQAFILSDPNGTVAPTIKQGAYISHGGSLYIVDTADATISGSPSDGTVYVRVSGTDTLTAEYVTDISSYAWSSAYNAMISGSYTLLPYMLIKSGTSWTKYRFEQHKQSLGTFKSLNVTDNITLGGTVDGHDIDSELDTLNSDVSTLNGRVNQAVNTTSSPTFANATIAGHNVDTQLDRINQDVKNTASPTFVNVHAKVNDAEFYTGGAKKATRISKSGATGAEWYSSLVGYLPSAGDRIFVSGYITIDASSQRVIVPYIDRGSNDVTIFGINIDGGSGTVYFTSGGSDTFSGSIVL